MIGHVSFCRIWVYQPPSLVLVAVPVMHMHHFFRDTSMPRQSRTRQHTYELKKPRRGRII